MAKLMMTISMLFVLGLVCPGVAAQSETVEGFQSAFERSYGYDLQMMQEEKDEETGEFPAELFLSSILISGYTFETESQANAFIEFMESELTTAIASNPEAFANMDVSEWEDFELSGLRVTIQLEGEVGLATSQTVFAIDNQVYQVQVRTNDLETSESTADSIIEFVVNAEIQSDEVVFNEGGTSTGGVFDRMPTIDDEVIGDFTNIGDKEISLTD